MYLKLDTAVPIGRRPRSRFLLRLQLGILEDPLHRHELPLRLREARDHGVQEAVDGQGVRDHQTHHAWAIVLI